MFPKEFLSVNGNLMQARVPVFAELESEKIDFIYWTKFLYMR